MIPISRIGRALMIMLPVAIIDRLTKKWAWEMASHPEIKGLMRVTPVRNTGVAFGALSDGGTLLCVLTGVIIACAIYFLLSRNFTSPTRIGLCLVIAGGLGNLYDRIIYGYVIDFIELLFVRFAVFNISDIAVVVGAILMAIGVLFSGGKNDRTAPL